MWNVARSAKELIFFFFTFIHGYLLRVGMVSNNITLGITSAPPQNYAGVYIPNKHHKDWQVTGLTVHWKNKQMCRYLRAFPLYCWAVNLPHALSIPDPYMKFGQTQTYVIKNTSLAHMEKPRRATHLYLGHSASQSLLNHFQMTSEQMVMLLMKHYNSQGRIASEC